MKTIPKAIAVARVGTKFGLRVLDADEADVFALVRPGLEFVKAKVTKRFRLHPLPHGTQRADIISLLKHWQWHARPLQPARGDRSGTAWLVGADSDPPTLALPSGDGFAIVTPIGASELKPEPEKNVYATHRTRLSIQHAEVGLDSKGEDPWQKGLDPCSRQAQHLLPHSGRRSASPGFPFWKPRCRKRSKTLRSNMPRVQCRTEPPVL